MKAYISGPMSGLPNKNRAAFYAAEEELRARGYDVVNPARVVLPEGVEKTWFNYMKKDIADMVWCDEVFVLPGWDRSVGALLECRLAMQLGITIRNMLGNEIFYVGGSSECA